MIQAYPKLYAWAAIITVLIVLAVSFGLSTIAHAQESAPAAPPVGAEGIIGLVRESLTASLVAIIGAILAWLSTQASKWLGGRIDLNSTLEALNWEQYVTSASASAFDYARVKTGITPEAIATYEQKSDFLRFAIDFFDAHHGDIVQYVDANGNGVIDILESRLATIAPNMPALAPLSRPVAPPEEPTTLSQAHALMSAPRRAVTPKPVDDIRQMASKLVRGKAAPHGARAN